MKPRAQPARDKDASQCLSESTARARLRRLNFAVGRWRYEGLEVAVQGSAGMRGGRFDGLITAPSGGEHSSLTHTNTQSGRHTANNSLTSALSTQPPVWLTRMRRDPTD